MGVREYQKVENPCTILYKQYRTVDVEWSIGSTYDPGARGPGFDPTPNPDGIFWKTLITLLSDNGLKNDSLTCKLWCHVKINNIKKKKKHRTRFNKMKQDKTISCALLFWFKNQIKYNLKQVETRWNKLKLDKTQWN